MDILKSKRILFGLFLLLFSIFLVIGCSTPTHLAPQEEQALVPEPGSEDWEKGEETGDLLDSESLEEQKRKEEQSKPQGEESAIVGGRQEISSIPVLYYHSIDYEEGNELRVPKEEFDAHMNLLYQEGYTSITPDQLYAYFYEGGSLPEKPFLLTFDDGYEDNYTNGFPVVQKYGFVGTVFMVTDWIDGRNYLKTEQLKEMAQAGWTIASHTRSHPYLTGLNQEQRKEELEGSKKALEEVLGQPVRYFAYPYGVYDQNIINDCITAGYAMAFTIERGWASNEDPFRLKRVYCYANMGLEELKRRIEDPNY